MSAKIIPFKSKSITEKQLCEIACKKFSEDIFYNKLYYDIDGQVIFFTSVYKQMDGSYRSEPDPNFDLTEYDHD